jgi:hypothetical protein
MSLIYQRNNPGHLLDLKKAAMNYRAKISATGYFHQLIVPFSITFTLLNYF